MESRCKLVAPALGALLCATTSAACSNDDNGENMPANEQPSGNEANSFQQTILVSDQSGQADHVDANLVNAWGLAFGPGTFFWVANNGTGTATVYDDEGAPAPQGAPIVVSVGSGDEQGPTGMVFNGSDAFMVQSAGKSGPSRFLFVTTDGKIWGWNPDVDATRAVVAVDNSGNEAIYTGLALSDTGGQPALYAADFHGAKIDAYDGTFQPMNHSGAFTDPDLPEGYAPFGIAAIGDTLYVAYAEQDEDREEEVAGSGKGFVDAYSATGELRRRVASAGALNAPWGMTLAPDGFGAFGGSLLVGNFGDGRIHGYSESGESLGALENEDGTPMVIDGLWALAFGNGAQAGDADELYFTAGPEEETHGLFGEIAAGDDSED